MVLWQKKGKLWFGVNSNKLLEAKDQAIPDIDIGVALVRMVGHKRISHHGCLAGTLIPHPALDSIWTLNHGRCCKEAPT